MIRSIRLSIREPFEGERVVLIGQLGDERKIITPVAVGVVEIPGFGDSPESDSPEGHTEIRDALVSYQLPQTEIPIAVARKIVGGESRFSL